MNRSAKLPQRGGKTLIPPTMTLALVRVRKTWGLLLVTGLGMVAAVMIACAVPLYSNVSMTAGLRSALSSTAQNADIVVTSTSQLLSPGNIANVTTELNQEFADKLGPFLLKPQFSVQPPVLPVYTSATTHTYKVTDDLLQVYGTDMQQAAPHLKLLQGRLPTLVPNGKVIEIALTAESAKYLHATIGTNITINFAYVYIPVSRKDNYLPLRVVGIVDTPSVSDSYWHQTSFQSLDRSKGAFGPKGRIYTVLAANEPFINAVSQLSPDNGVGSFVLESPFDLFWYYRFDTEHLSINDLNAIDSGANTVQVDVSNNQDFNRPPYFQKTQAYLPTDILNLYVNRIAIAQLPVTSLLALVLGLILYFVSMMADVLVDRQSDAIAILRSRGASRRQIFGSLVTQTIGLGLLALIIGPLLALLIVRVAAQFLLSAADQSSLNVLSGNLFQVFQSAWPYALVTVVVSVIAMIVSVSRTTRQDVLSIRRESARSTRLPLWQRLNLDVVAAIVMIVGYGFLLYLTNSGVLDPHLTLLLLTPLTLVGAVFLLLACLLLFLRFFPYLLRLGSWLTARSRTASPMLALAQMARAPRQSVRMTLLLALATAFAIFTLVFTASQTQRISDTADYQSGADFSGSIQNANYTPLQVNEITGLYRRIPGVLSASVGNNSSATGAGSILSVPVDLRAVDASDFAQTAIWSGQNSSQSLSSLMSQLLSQRQQSATTLTVPALVDASLWNALKLSPGANFALNFTDGLINFTAVAEVNHIPTTIINSNAGNSSAGTASGGVMVDYPSLAKVYGIVFKDTGGTLPLNTIYLRTKSDAVSLNSVRKALNQGVLQLTPLYDRRAIAENLYNEPLYRDLIGILFLGATTALLLALLGNLIASWLSARNRLANFAVLRALGAAPTQIASTLTWEQFIIYATSIVLGLLFGAILSVLVVPVLVFTSVGSSGITSNASNSQFFVAQSVPPIQIVVPSMLWYALAVLVLICVIALGMMVRIVSRPSISQTLRLNED